jgi:hypothetical protein
MFDHDTVGATCIPISVWRDKISYMLEGVIELPTV